VRADGGYAARGGPGALGRGGVLVNVGRGGLVDEPELVRCLREGVVSSAGPEVLAELLAMDNIVLSGHRVVLTSESMCSNPRAKRPSGRAKKERGGRVERLGHDRPVD